MAGSSVISAALLQVRYVSRLKRWLYHENKPPLGLSIDLKNDKIRLKIRKYVKKGKPYKSGVDLTVRIAFQWDSKVQLDLFLLRQLFFGLFFFSNHIPNIKRFVIELQFRYLNMVKFGKRMEWYPAATNKQSK